MLLSTRPRRAGRRRGWGLFTQHLLQTRRLPPTYAHPLRILPTALQRGPRLSYLHRQSHRPSSPLDADPGLRSGKVGKKRDSNPGGRALEPRPHLPRDGENVWSACVLKRSVTGCRSGARGDVSKHFWFRPQKGLVMLPHDSRGVPAVTTVFTCVHKERDSRSTGRAAASGLGAGPPRQSWGSRGSASPASAAAEVESRALGSRTNRPDPGSDHARPGLPDSCSSVLWPVWGWGCSTVTVTVTGGAQPSPWRHRAASSTRGPQLQTPSPNSSVLAPAGVRWPWAWRLPPTPRQPASTLPHQPGAQGQPGDPVTFQKCPVHHHHPLGFSGSQHEPAWPSPDSGPHPFQLPTATQAREEPGSRGWKSRLTEVGL